jgi:hypothetical protein
MAAGSSLEDVKLKNRMAKAMLENLCYIYNSGRTETKEAEDTTFTREDV